MSNTICHKKLFLLLFTIATAPRMESTVSAHSYIPSPSSLNSSSAPYAPSLPPTTHHLLHLIITPSTSPLLLPWQQQCWAQVPMSPVVTSLPLTITIHYIKIKSANHFFLHGWQTVRGRVCSKESEEAVIYFFKSLSQDLSRLFRSKYCHFCKRVMITVITTILSIIK